MTNQRHTLLRVYTSSGYESLRGGYVPCVTRGELSTLARTPSSPPKRVERGRQSAHEPLENSRARGARWRGATVFSSVDLDGLFRRGPSTWARLSLSSALTHPVSSRRANCTSVAAATGERLVPHFRLQWVAYLAHEE